MKPNELEKYVEEHMLLDSGYLNMGMYIDLDIPYIVVISPRGTGKTFGIYQEGVKKNKQIFSVRRKEKQYKLTANPITTPLNKPLSKLGISFNIEKIEEGLSCAYDNSGKPLVFMTYAGNLTDMRGFNADEVEIMLYDEGVPEGEERKRRGEGLAMLHAYETINRNRELEGIKPLKFILLCNYDNAGADIFVKLKIVTELYRLQAGHCKYIDKRGLLLVNTGETPISRQKENTALYKLVGDGEFKNVAIKNITPTQFNKTVTLPYRELKLRFNIGEVSIYWWTRGHHFYASHVSNTKANTYNTDKEGIQKFKMLEREFLIEYCLGGIIYENELLQTVLKSYIN